MALTTETPQALQAGVAPYSMQKGYDERMLQNQQGIDPRAIAATLQSFGAPQGPQNTVMTPEQLQMNEAMIRESIAGKNAGPGYTDAAQANAAAIDAANQKARYDAYMAKQNKQNKQPQQPVEDSGIFSGASKWFK